MQETVLVLSNPSRRARYRTPQGYPGPFPEGIVWPPVPLYRNSTIVEQPFNATDLTDRYTAEAVAFVQANGAVYEDSGAPFFLHLAYEAPHVPLFTGPRWAGRSRRGPYGDAVMEMDDSVGQVMAAVRASPALATSTLVIFLSDNGAWINANSGLSSGPINSISGIGPFDGGSNGPFYEGKGSTYEGGVRVPCLAWWPGTVPAASIAVAPVSAMDLFPTALAFAGAAPPAGLVLDGKDATAVLTGQDLEVGPWYDDFLFFWRESQVYAVRHQRFKVHYITRSGFNISDLGVAHDPPLVYDVEADYGEAKCLDTDPTTASAEVLAVLDATDAALAAHLASLGTLPPAQYGPQDWHLVPCCPRGAFDLAQAKAYAEEGAWGMAIWDKCVCAREDPS